MSFSYIFITIIGVILLFLVVGIIIYFNIQKNKKKKESELGIFNHPSNFKKAPIEWVQKPKAIEADKTKRLD